MQDPPIASDDPDHPSNENDYNIGNEYRENYTRFIYQTLIWQSLMFVIQLGLIFDSRDQFMSLRQDSIKSFYYIGGNIILYLLGVISNILALICSKRYHKILRFGYCFTFFLFTYSIIGLSFVANDMFKL
jgi:hypothetical protein